MALSSFLKKGITKTARFKEAQEEMKIQQILEERQKSSNERELERFIEEEREKSIRQNLEEFRNIRQKEAMKTTVLGGGNNMFKGKGNIASGPTTVLQNNDRLLTMKSTKSKGMFFK